MPRVLTLLLHAGIATAAWEGLPPPFPALLETAARGAPSFTIPPGEYNFGDLLVDLYELTDFEVEATGVTFWFSKGGGLRFFFCRNLRWGGSHPFAPFAVDYDPPLYSQGRVTRVSDLATSGKVEAVFDAAFPMPSVREAVFAKSRTFKVAFWDPLLRTMRRNPNEGAINLWWQHSLPLGGTRYRLEVGESNKVADYPVPPMVGDLITVAPIGYPHAVSILQSEEVTLQARCDPAAHDTPVPLAHTHHQYDLHPDTGSPRHGPKLAAGLPHLRLVLNGHIGVWGAGWPRLRAGAHRPARRIGPAACHLCRWHPLQWRATRADRPLL